MKENVLIEILKSLPIFYKIHPEDIPTLIQCLGAVTKTYHKGEYLLHEGQDITHLLVILQGQVDMYKNSGTVSSLMKRAAKGDVLGAASIGRETCPCQMSAVAVSSCTVLAIPYRRLMFHCTRNCPFHHLLVKNLVITISEGQRHLYEKILVISQKSIRDKILVFLRLQTPTAEDGSVTIPYSRTELAQYLCADRSALSRELALMQREGILSIQENTFILLNPSA
ncbi:MAG: Crp/Fnr family transcriptional regulator [Lachnospiraceae bacterium]|nr:Crp/Fnr family transcriptional regulator [Lachnospiraceae bacterium]